MNESKQTEPRNLEEYLNFHRQRYPGEEITAEFLTVIRRYLEIPTRHGIDDDVYCAKNFLAEIGTSIDAFKKEWPEATLDIEMLEILACVNRNCGSKTIAEVLKIAVTVRQYSDEFRKASADLKLSSMTREVFCYIAQSQPEINPDRALVLARSIQDKITPYLNRFKTSMKRYPDTNIIKYCLWVATEYPGLDPQKAGGWAESIASSNTYRQLLLTFPSTYPFSFMTFTSYIDGKATLTIGAKTCLGSPSLYFLLNFPNSQKGYIDKSVNFEFNLNETDTPQTILKAVDSIIDTIESTLVPHSEDANIFHDRKWELKWAARAYCKDYAEGFSGLKYLQFEPPTADSDNHSSEIGKAMYKNIEELNYDALEKMLREGANPNLRQWGTSMLEQVAYLHKPKYEVKMMAGELKMNHIQEFYRDYEDKKKYPTNPDGVIITHIFNHYYIYWHVGTRYQGQDKQFIANARVEAADDIQFLDSIKERYCKTDGRLQSVSNPNHINRLRELILPYLQSTLEQQRKRQVQMILKITALLMEFGADPATRRYPEHPGTKTVIETLMDYSHVPADLDALCRGLLVGMVKLMLHADRGRSHLTIAGDYDKHFLGEFILKGQKALFQEGKLPPQIESVSALNSWIGQFLEITNYKQSSVYLCTIPLAAFTEHEQIVQLCRRAFPSIATKLPSEEFYAYIMKKLKPGKDVGVIDLIYGTNGQILAFNIAKIVLPRTKDKPILHYIPLASSDKVIQTEFRELMSQVSFQRIVFLKEKFKAEVLTFYTAASAMSYLQVAKLPRVYPKHDCLRPCDLQYVRDEFFPDREIAENHGVLYFSSLLFYHVPEKKKGVMDESDINYIGFTNRIEKEGYCPLIGFYATPDNLQKLARKIKTQLGNGLTFFSIASNTSTMSESSFKFSPKL